MASISRPTLQILLAIGLVCVLSAGGWWATSTARPTPPSNTRLFVEPTTLDFREVLEDERFAWALKIENHGTADADITDFRGSCVCTAVEPRHLTVPAGESREIRLTLDLTHRGVAGPQDEMGPFRVSITPVLTDAGGGGGLSWELTGRVRPVIRFDAGTLDLGRHSDRSPGVAATAMLTACVPLRGIEATAVTPGWRAAVRALPDEKRFEVDLGTVAMPTVGEVRPEVRLTPIAADGERLPARTLKASGWVVPDLEPSLPHVHFGARAVGGTATEALTLRSLTGRVYDITGVRVEGEGLTAERRADLDIGGPTFVLTQRIARTGARTGKVAFTARDSKGRETITEVAVGYNGIVAKGRAVP